MKYLTQGGMSEARFEVLMRGTSIRSDDVKFALKLYLVNGLSEATAAVTAEIPLSNFTRALNAAEQAESVIQDAKALDWAHFKSVK